MKTAIEIKPKTLSCLKTTAQDRGIPPQYQRGGKHSDDVVLDGYPTEAGAYGCHPTFIRCSLESGRFSLTKRAEAAMAKRAKTTAMAIYMRMARYSINMITPLNPT